MLRIRVRVKNCNDCPVRFLCLTTSKVLPKQTDMYEERIIDLTCDVWGGAGPDCCIQPS